VAGAALVGAALIGGIVLLVAGGGSDSSSKASSPQITDLQNKFLNHTVVIPDKGISVRRPGDWTDSKRNGAIAMQSHDRCLAMTLSAPVPAAQAKGLRSDSIELLRRSYENAKVGSAPDSQIGGIPTSSDTVNFTDQKGNPIRVLVGVGAGKKNAYLTEVVVRDPTCQGDLNLAQVVLSSVQYTK
jgi:hypothetical protein